MRKISIFKLKIDNAIFPETISSQFFSQRCTERQYENVKATVNIHLDYLLPSNKKNEIIECLKVLSLCSIQKTIDDANLVCDHIFNLFGKNYSSGHTINWHKDIVSGYEWPLTFYADSTIIDLTNNSDVKFPWELNRFQHAIILGKAYWFTGDERYTDEFVSQVYSWTEHNPPQKGINWNCSMEVAIRAINLIWAYCFFIDSKRLSEKFHSLFLSMIFAHGRHIYRNLENTSIIRGNHYLCNLVGLIYIGSVFPIFKSSQKWRLFAQNELIKEMDDQVYEDGTNFESSIPYHRFVTELFLHASLLLIMSHRQSHSDSEVDNYKSAGEEILGVNYITKLEKMCRFILSYTNPDGLAPQIGDNDNGRLINFECEMHNINDHRHILAIAGEFFNNDDFRHAGRNCYEDAVWIYAADVKMPDNEKLVVHSICYKDAGIYIMRNDNDYLIVRCGRLGTSGKGTHTHNDNLSFELCADGTTYITDPGTYTYSRDAKQRNMFRSTEYHNTLMIDGREQNRLSETDMFLLYKNSESRVLVWKQSDDEDFFSGEITINSEDGNSIIHRREIHFDKKNKTWNIRDLVLGYGKHLLIWNFHAHESIAIDLKNELILFNNSSGKILSMELSRNINCNANIINGWYSPSYDMIKPASILRLSVKTDLPFENNFSFHIKRASL